MARRRKNKATRALPATTNAVVIDTPSASVYRHLESREHQAMNLCGLVGVEAEEDLESAIAKLVREREERKREQADHARERARWKPRMVIFMSDAGPSHVTPEQLSALQQASEGGHLGRRLRGFSTAADTSGNVLIDLSGHHLMGDPVWGRKMAFALLYASEIAHITRKQMGSKMGYQQCESLFHCNCYFGLRTPQHEIGKIGKCCFCDRLATEDDRDPIASLEDGR